MVVSGTEDKKQDKDFACSFPPVFRSDAQILLLGSMPGKTSLRDRQYYAHPQNSFWPIIESLFGVADKLSYIERTNLLIRNRVALWDVLRSCIRNGSLDSSIQSVSATANDFSAFFKAVPEIRAVFFNGATAEREYMKRVVPTLPGRPATLPTYRLPSTSPAMAVMSREQKLERWRLITKQLDCVA